MGYRRNSWQQITWRKVGASSSLSAPTVGGVFRFWDPSKWNVGADSPQVAAGTVSYNVAGAQDFIYAYPITFERAGTITALGQHIGNNTGRVWMGLYSTVASAPWLPTARQFDVEKVAPGFNQPVTSVCSVAVTSGQTIWFAAVYNNNGVAGGCINITVSSQIRDQWGTDWDGVTAGAPTIAHNVGYRHAFAYAQLPATFPGAGTPTILKSNGVASPVTMFKFQPS